MDRKKIVFAGNCNATDMCAAFADVDILRDDFVFHAIAFHATPVPSPELRVIVENAHAVFVQGIAEAERFRQASVPTSVRCHGYPNLLRRTFWPFDALVYGRDPLAEASAAALGHVRFPDGLLGRLRAEIPDPERRFIAYRDLDVGGINKNFLRLLEMEDEMMMNIDHSYTCDLGRFVRENARTTQLFHWLGHPSGVLYVALMRYCCGKLGLEVALPDPSALDAWGAMQVPVHPRVAERLGLDWAAPDRVYRYGPVGETTWESYARMYIEKLG